MNSPDQLFDAAHVSKLQYLLLHDSFSVTFFLDIFFTESHIQAILCVNTVWQYVNNTSAKLLWSVPSIFINTSHKVVYYWHLTSNTVCTVFFVYKCITCNSPALLLRHNINVACCMIFSHTVLQVRQCSLVYFVCIHCVQKYIFHKCRTYTSHSLKQHGEKCYVTGTSTQNSYEDSPACKHNWLHKW